MVDCTALKDNTVHTVDIDLVEDGTNERVCSIPVTVVKGAEIAPGDIAQREKSFLPGEITRDYYVVPEHATYATLTLAGTGGKYLVHSMQSVSGLSYPTLSNEWFLNMAETGRRLLIPTTFRINNNVSNNSCTTELNFKIKSENGRPVP